MKIKNRINAIKIVENLILGFIKLYFDFEYAGC